MFRDRHTITSRVVLDDRSRLPWRFFGRLTTAALAALSGQRAPFCRAPVPFLISNPDSRPDPMSDKNPTTLYDKIWNDHLVHEAGDGTCLLYIDRHLVHEVTSPQACEGLR